MFPAPALQPAPWSTLELCRTPTSGGPPWEATLAAANSRALTLSAGHVQRSVPGVTELLSEGWGCPPRSLPQAVAWATDATVAKLFDDLVRDHHLPTDRLRAWGPDGLVDAGSAFGLTETFGLARSDPATLAGFLVGGGSVCILGVDEQSSVLTEHAEHLDRVLGGTTRTDLSLISVSGPGTTAAADGAARLFVTLRGVGHVEAVPPSFGPTGSAGRRSDTQRLTPETTVYLPPGWEHRVVASGDDDLVVAVTVLPRQSVVEILRAAASDAVYWPVLRADVPVDPRGVVLSYAGSVFDSPDRMVKALEGLFDAATVDRTLARIRGRMGSRWRSSAVDTILAVAHDDVGAVRFPIPGGVQVGPEVDDGTAITLYAGGVKFTAPTKVAQALGRVADGARHEVDELADLVDAPMIAREALGLPIAEVVT